jgi:tetratricopeptide (TPR) repeat protein
MTAVLEVVLVVLLAAPSAEPEHLLEEAVYRRRILGDAGSAAALLERVLAGEIPAETRERARLERVRCLAALGKHEEAEDALSALLDDPELTVASVRDQGERLLLSMRREGEIRGLESRAEDLRRRAKAREISEDEARKEIEKLQAEIARLRAQEASRSPAPPPADPDELLRRERREKLRKRAEAQGLLEKAREFEQQGDLPVARALLRNAVDLDPENVAAAEALRAIGARLESLRGDPRRELEMELEVRREIVPRDVERLHREGRQAWSEGRTAEAAEMFAAILQIRIENPGVTDLIADRVRSAGDYLEQAMARGVVPPALLRLLGEEDAEDWRQQLREVLDAIREDPKLDCRFYTLAHLDGGPDEAAVVRRGRLRIAPPERFPVRALAELVRLRVAPGTWDGRVRFVQVVEDRRLAVRHDARVVREVEGLLESLGRPGATTRRVTFDLLRLRRDELSALARDLGLAFREKGGVAGAALDEARLSVWRKRTARLRRLGRGAGVADGRALGVSLARSLLATIGYFETEAGGVSVILPRQREVREGLRLGVVLLEGDDDEVVGVGVEGAVTNALPRLDLPFGGGRELHWRTAFDQPLGLAAEVPTRGGLLLAGLVPVGAEDDEEVLAVLVALGDLDAPTAGPRSTKGAVRIEELTVAEDAIPDAFELESIWRGPGEPLGRAALVRTVLGARGLEVAEEDEWLLPAGERAAEAGEALRAIRERRADLIEIRARAVVAGEREEPGGARLPVEPQGSVAAWCEKTNAAARRGSDRLTVGRVVAASLQRVHLSRVVRSTYVKEYEVAPEGGRDTARPVLGRIGKGIVLDLRPLLDRDGEVLLSVVVKVARLEGLDDVRIPLEVGGAPLLVTSPRQIVRRARVLVRLGIGQRLVLSGLPDPDGGPDDRILVEIEARGVGR